MKKQDEKCLTGKKICTFIWEIINGETVVWHIMKCHINIVKRPSNSDMFNFKLMAVEQLILLSASPPEFPSPLVPIFCILLRHSAPAVSSLTSSINLLLGLRISCRAAAIL